MHDVEMQNNGADITHRFEFQCFMEREKAFNHYEHG
jgi:hypothetical protein